jgi:hypothetical protein
LQRKIRGKWEYVRDANNNPRTFEGAINPEDLGILDEEQVRAEIFYQHACLRYQTAWLLINQGTRPQATPEVIPTIQAKIEQAPVPQRPNLKLEAKLLGIMGDEQIDLEDKVISSPLTGAFGQVIVKGKRAIGWASLLGTRHELEYQGAGGARYSRSFRQTNVGAAFSFGQILVLDIEGITSQSGWSTDRLPLINSIIDESRYKGLFLSGGLNIPGDFTQEFSLQLTGGLGIGIESIEATDHLYRNFVIESRRLDELFVKGRIDAKHFRLTASAGSFESSAEKDDDPRIEGSRLTFTASGNIPLSRSIYLTPQVILNKTTYEGLDTKDIELNRNLVGLGLTIKW